MPLGARLSFFRDAAAYFTGEHAIRLKFIRSNDGIRDCDLSDGSDDWRLPADAPIYLTNFESIREGKVDPRLFTGASLDEGDILRRSEERRVGKECVSTGRSRWSPDH